LYGIQLSYWNPDQILMMMTPLQAKPWSSEMRLPNKRTASYRPMHRLVNNDYIVHIRSDWGQPPTGLMLRPQLIFCLSCWLPRGFESFEYRILVPNKHATGGVISSGRENSYTR
jgi:hypothetical protein